MVKNILIGVVSLIIIFVIIIYLIPEKNNFKYKFDKDSVMTLKHSVKINTTPDKIWKFLIDIDIDNNYKSWQPDDHILFEWTKGKPWALESELYSEQYMGGKLVKYKGIITESIPEKKVTFKFSFPISIINPKNEFIIEGNNNYSTFTGVTYIKFNKLFRILFKDQINEMIESVEKHTNIENENMKRILENKD